jgi:hypothetical protein
MVATPPRWNTAGVTVLGTDFLAVTPVVLVALVLVLACRWTFGTKGVRRIVARPDYGLLSPAARLPSVEAATAAAGELRAHGLRATVAPAGKGFDARGIPWPAAAHVVLVFPDDVERATALLAGANPSAPSA